MVTELGFFHEIDGIMSSYEISFDIHDKLNMLGCSLGKEQLR